MKTKLVVECIDQSMSMLKSNAIASGGVNENYAKFHFCSKWSGFSKTAVFYKFESERYYSVLNVSGECTIPHEVTDDDGAFYFGVFGVDANENVKTTNLLKVTVSKGTFTEGLKPSEPTEEIWAQLIAESQKVQASTKDHLLDKNNPHGVTKEQVGLGNVPNVSTNDQTPSFEVPESRENLKSGEKLSVLFGKIGKFFNDLKKAAFSGVVNGFGETEEGNVLDARAGKTLYDKIEKVKEVAENNAVLIKKAPNANLFVNGSFNIWQRGEEFYPSEKGIDFYCADRWHITCPNNLGSTVVMYESGVGIVCYANDTSTNFTLVQVVEPKTLEMYERRILTLSYVITDGGSYEEKFTRQIMFDDVARRNHWNSPFDFCKRNFSIEVPARMAVRWAKLEVSDYPTDIYPIPYDVELETCRKYYQTIASGNKTMFGTYSGIFTTSPNGVGIQLDFLSKMYEFGGAKRMFLSGGQGDDDMLELTFGIESDGGFPESCIVQFKDLSLQGAGDVLFIEMSDDILEKLPSIRSFPIPGFINACYEKTLEFDNEFY